MSQEVTRLLPAAVQGAMTARDTGVAKLPSLPVLRTADPQVNEWARKVKEVIDTRAGANGNPWEKTATLRDLKDAATLAATIQAKPAQPGPDDLVLNLGGGVAVTATGAINQFIDALKASKLYKDMMKRLDDPTRFDDLPAEVREIALKSIADEAAARGADVKRIELKIQNANRSLMLLGQELTAAVEGASAGIRNLEWATAEKNFAQAGQLTQLEASLGNYYQDGRPGRVMLEQQMYATADRVQGLSGQITVKLQAGGALAGWGLAASENTAGVQSSAFIVSSDKFAVVLPSYAPPTRPVYERDADGNIVYKNGYPVVAYNQILAHEIPTNQGGVPFGIDAWGIYLNNNVYIKGDMRIDTSGRTLIQGLRGSVMVAVTNPGAVWNDNVARQLVWTTLKYSDFATNNNHLVIGDTVTIGETTRQWTGSAWEHPGVVINGSLLINGSVAATKIDTRGLDIRDEAGNIIFSSGTKLNVSRIQGLGALATGDKVNIGWAAEYSDVLIDGVPMKTADFVHALSKINATNISTFVENAAIGSAYIGNAAILNAHIENAQVTTLKLGANAVTVPTAVTASHIKPGEGNDVWLDYLTHDLYIDQPGQVIIIAVCRMGTDGTGWRTIGTRLIVDGTQVSMGAIDSGYHTDTHSHRVVVSGPRTVSAKIQFYGQTANVRMVGCTLIMLGIKR